MSERCVVILLVKLKGGMLSRREGRQVSMRINMPTPAGAGEGMPLETERRENLPHTRKVSRSMQKWLFVGCGGFVGSVVRYVLSGIIQRLTGSFTFPYGTLAVNLVGCFAIGVLGGLFESRGVFSEPARLFLLVGLLGGFTTFSTFGFETFSLLRDGETPAALGNAIVQVVGGVAAVWAGIVISRFV